MNKRFNLLLLSIVILMHINAQNIDIICDDNNPIIIPTFVEFNQDKTFSLTLDGKYYYDYLDYGGYRTTDNKLLRTCHSVWFNQPNQFDQQERKILTDALLSCVIKGLTDTKLNISSDENANNWFKSKDISEKYKLLFQLQGDYFFKVIWSYCHYVQRQRERATNGYYCYRYLIGLQLVSKKTGNVIFQKGVFLDQKEYTEQFIWDDRGHFDQICNFLNTNNCFRDILRNLFPIKTNISSIEKANKSNKIAIYVRLNKGTNNGVYKGLLFDAYQGSPQNKVGEMEVVEADETTALCRIINGGDKIINYHECYVLSRVDVTYDNL